MSYLVCFVVVLRPLLVRMLSCLAYFRTDNGGRVRGIANW